MSTTVVSAASSVHTTQFESTYKSVPYLESLHQEMMILFNPMLDGHMRGWIDGDIVSVSVMFSVVSVVHHPSI